MVTSAEHTPRACSYTMAAVTRSTGNPWAWHSQARLRYMKTLPGM